jgi:uncharacterized protein YgiM (DUF1202 family)
VRAAEPAVAETQQAAVTPEPAPAPAPAIESAPIEIEDMAGVYVAKKSANVRAAPNTDAKVLTKLAADQAADVTGQVVGGEWLRVSAAGKEGFVSASLMAEIQRRGSGGLEDAEGKAERERRQGVSRRASGRLFRA